MAFLHAPWRSHYLTGAGGNRDSIFEEIIRSNEDDANGVILRSKSCLAVLNRFPYNTAHVMVLPYKITGDLLELSAQELAEMMGMCQRVVAAVQAEFKPHGFNVGFNLGAAAGAGIPGHLHLHIVPRWEGDHNFMTVLSGTRVNPNDLAEVQRRLKARLAD